MMEGPTSPVARCRGLRFNRGGQGPIGVYGKPEFSVYLEMRVDSRHRNVGFPALSGR